MSIVQSIDAEISGLQEEIDALEAQLSGRRSRLDALNELRERAQSLNGEGGGLPDLVDKPRSSTPPEKPQARAAAPKQRSAPTGDLADKVVAYIAKHPHSSGAAIARGLDLGDHTGQARVSYYLRALGDKLAFTKVGNSKLWRLAEVEEAPEGPKQAPARVGRATPAPARRTESRRNHQAAEAHNALRAKVKAAVLEVLADGPMGKDRLNGAVLERVPEAIADDVGAVRTTLMGKTGQIEMRANKVCLSGVDRTGPITNVEKEVVGCLGSGRTAREVAANCKLVRDAFSARTILAALTTRGVVAQRPDSSPPVYEPLAGDLEAAA